MAHPAGKGVVRAVVPLFACCQPLAPCSADFLEPFIPHYAQSRLTRTFALQTVLTWRMLHPNCSAFVAMHALVPTARMHVAVEARRAHAYHGVDPCWLHSSHRAIIGTIDT